jgi:hypothetical protein
VLKEEAIRSISLLEGVAQKLGVEVRYESLHGNDDLGASRGGFCLLRGRRLILIEQDLPLQDRCAILARSLGELDLSRVFIPPAARDLIERAGEGR